jgi:nucleoside-diphosphate-sugar epimerase
MVKFKKVLVTGGAGYVGSALVPALLNAGYAVRVLDLYLYGNPLQDVQNDPKLEQIKGDLRDQTVLDKAAQGCDAVIHLACVSNDPSFELDPALGKSINYDAFFGLMKAVRKTGVQRLIYASSSSVYGLREEPDVREETPCTPLTDYSKYKLMCEEALRTDGLGGAEYVIVRPATVCGYAARMRLDLSVNILTIHALVKKQITVFGGSQLRPNINILDMVDVYKLLLEAPKEKVHREVFNAGYENKSLFRIAEMVKTQLKDPTITIKVEPTNDLRSYHVNSDKIARILGFRARHTLEEAIESIHKAFQAGKFQDPLTNPLYYNIKTMQLAKLGG